MQRDNQRLTRLALGYLTDIKSGTLALNLPMYLNVYSAHERSIAYRFLVHYAPTFKVLFPVFKSGQITQTQMFNAVYSLLSRFQ